MPSMLNLSLGGFGRHIGVPQGTIEELGGEGEGDNVA